MEKKMIKPSMNDLKTDDRNVVFPIYAGLFARCSYPVSKAFFMSFRFELDREADEASLKKAWDETTKVYPYLTYAVVVRNGKYEMAKNPLPFVICETEEVLEPFGKTGNFHTTTICYKGKTLHFYIDHVPFDGTGVRFLMETFFYYYYCFSDGIDYPVPEGILTKKDIPIEGLCEDAYLDTRVKPIDINPEKAFADEKTFLMPESTDRVLFVPAENCACFCISVPKKDMMDYAKSVSGTPMSLISVLIACAIQSVHPDNKLPVKISTPVSIRKVMGNEHSLLHQIVHMKYMFDPDSLMEEGGEGKLIRDYRAFLKDFTSEDNIITMCGVYSGIIQGMMKLMEKGDTEETIIKLRENGEAAIAVSYIGQLKTGEYGNRFRMTVFRTMRENGIMVQAVEIGGVFYLCWYQGFLSDCYVKVLTKLFKKLGMKNAVLERIPDQTVRSL
ncbi:MAG: hypothetical protein J6I76_06540 [Oribacterium sp.]|nr:hypothetical protein [Oribacterium sp.]MBP3803545.1 hypothetical protein [Oribacterium sp.]